MRKRGTWEHKKYIINRFFTRTIRVEGNITRNFVGYTTTLIVEKNQAESHNDVISRTTLRNFTKFHFHFPICILNFSPIKIKNVPAKSPRNPIFEPHSCWLLMESQVNQHQNFISSSSLRIQHLVYILAQSYSSCTLYNAPFDLLL